MPKITTEYHENKFVVFEIAANGDERDIAVFDASDDAYIKADKLEALALKLDSAARYLVRYDQRLGASV